MNFENYDFFGILEDFFKRVNSLAKKPDQSKFVFQTVCSLLKNRTNQNSSNLLSLESSKMEGCKHFCCHALDSDTKNGFQFDRCESKIEKIILRATMQLCHTMNTK